MSRKNNELIIIMILTIIVIIGIIVHMIISSGVLKNREEIKQENTKIEENINNKDKVATEEEKITNDTSSDLKEQPAGSETVVKTGGTKVEAQEGETHKGIVYLDPTNLKNKCTADNSQVGIGTSGCIKFYIFDDSTNEYKMILDHNTENSVVWDSSNRNVAYASSGAYQSIQSLGWDSNLNTRIITAEEINTITGKTSFDSANNDSWYYLDRASSGINLKKPYANSTTKSSYAWIYDYTNECVSYGCNTQISGSADYGYWISTTVGTAGSGSRVWRVSRYGYLYHDYAFTGRGIRPVISISKSAIN